MDELLRKWQEVTNDVYKYEVDVREGIKCARVERIYVNECFVKGRMTDR